MEKKNKPAFKLVMYGLVATLAFSTSNLVADAKTTPVSAVKTEHHVESKKATKKVDPKKTKKKEDSKSKKGKKEKPAPKKDPKKEKSEKPEKPEKPKKDDGEKGDKSKGKKDEKGKSSTRKLDFSDEVTVDGVVLSLATNTSEKTPHFTASLKNDSGVDKTATFSSSELYSYTIKNDKNKVVFDSKKEFFYMPVTFTKEISVNKQYAHSLELGKVVTEDLKEGVYTLFVTPEAEEFSGKPLTVDFKVHKGYKKK